MEQKYEFRRFLNEVHKGGRRDFSMEPEPDDIVIDESWKIAVAEDADALVRQAAVDLQEYFLVSMFLRLPLVRNAAERAIRFSVEKGGKARGFLFEADINNISITGHDAAGAMQGGFYLEELLNLREAPYLKPRKERREPVFSPRMVHSGWGLDQFPDAHLNAMAHAGFDSILIFVKGVDKTTHGTVDFNDLIDRAAKYSLGVYFYSYLPSFKHPDEPDADEFFEKHYGSVFKNCPRAKGLILVGESAQFPSKDPNCSGKAAGSNADNEGIADPRPCAGWWPSSDYPQWLNAVKKAVFRYAPHADIVFWTYNWGRAPEKYRLELINSLPDDVSLEATFEMFETHEYPNHTTVQPDYSITFPGPGKYFATEAKAAHRRGLRLYSMTNTGGMTWDFGAVPYVPVPQQWFKRFVAMNKAHKDWNLSGIMDAHHYGWYPSLISECAKWSFWTPAQDMDSILRQIVERDFGKDASKDVIAGYKAWSDAMDSYSPGFDDQAGPLRTGPSYPFILAPVLYPHVEQKMPFPMTGNAYANWINAFYITESIYGQSWCGLRVHEDMKIMSAAWKKWEKGMMLMRRALEKVPPKKLENAKKMIGVGEFCCHAFLTMLHTKKWWVLNKKLEVEHNVKTANKLLDEMCEIIRKERKNVEETLPLVERDSRLGWEPSMDYICDPAHIHWKLRQLDNLENNTLRMYRKSVAIRPEMDKS